LSFYQEHLYSQEDREDGLSGAEAALVKEESISIVAINYSLSKVLDISLPGSLTKFAKLLKNITISENIRSRAKKLGYPSIGMITGVPELKKSLLEKKWRTSPMRFDVPSNPQVFGKLAREAGLSGILYNSTINNGKCIAIFPDNLHGTDDYIELSDNPSDEKIPVRIDSTNFGLCRKKSYEVIDFD